MTAAFMAPGLYVSRAFLSRGRAQYFADDADLAYVYSYGSWFGVEAIVAGGDPNGTDAAALKKCCDFLLSKQLNDGGWGESYLSCLTKEYTMPPDGKSLVRR